MKKEADAFKKANKNNMTPEIKKIIKESNNLLDNMKRREKKASSEWGKAYQKAGGSRLFPDVVITERAAEDPIPNTDPNNGNIEKIYDFKFNCPDENGTPSQGSIDRKQVDKYVNALGPSDPVLEIIHPNTDLCN